MIITIIVCLLILLYFGALLGDAAMPVLSILVFGGLAWYFVKKTNVGASNGILGKDFPVAFVVFVYMTLNSLTSIGSLIGLLIFAGSAAVTVGLWMKTQNGNDQAKKIVCAGLGVLGLTQIYGLIRTIATIIISSSDIYYFGLNYVNNSVSFKLLYILFGIYGLFIYKNKKDNKILLVYYVVLIASYLFEGCVAFATGSIISYIYNLLISALYYWGIKSLDAMFFNTKPTKTLKLIPALIIVLTLFLSPMIMTGASYSASSPSNSIATCKSCGRSYSAGDKAGNYKNIARTGMCNNCYSNFKWGMKATGKWD